MKKIILIILFLLFVVAIVSISKNNKTEEEFRDPIKIGWVSGMTGTSSKYGTFEAGKMAMDEINAAGGINGRPLEIIFEDGQCKGTVAAQAANKLINIDNVKIILGGHCTPESAAIQPIAEKNKVLLFASVTSSPTMSNIGEYFFRTTSISTIQSYILANKAYNDLNLRNIAVYYEQTDYAEPIAEKFKEEFEKLGGNISVFEGFAPETNDFRTSLTKAKVNNVDGIFMSPQRPDAGINLVKQIAELNLNVQLFGNDIMSGEYIVSDLAEYVEGMLVASPEYDEENNPKSKKFAESYYENYGVANPFGVFTAESYDAVYIIAEAIEKYGEDIEKIKDYLSHLKNYDGVSGKISIDENHDGVREYSLKSVKNGTLEKVQ
ncbi:ABC transporter substrate-binding protein [Patescibacteria group bacterium]|nr:ABC transporter substrate-binding protein [Patescibacteria group bacterium]